MSVLCESEPVADALRDHAIRMLGPLGWHGVAMLEYKQDLRTGECFLIEVNGRFWGSLQLAVDAGMDFPALACELALGHRPQVLQPYKLGVRSRWLLGDLDHLLLRLFTTDRSSELPASVPSRLRTLLDFITCANHGSRDGIGDDADFGPFVHELREYARALVASAARRAGRRRAPAARVGPAGPVSRDGRSMTPYLLRQSHDTGDPRAIAPLPMRVCHVMSADLWAGAEVQVATTAAFLVTQPDVVLTAVLFNDGWLAGQLRRLGVETAVVDERRHNGFRIAAFVRRFLIEHQVDIVHTHRCKDTVLGTLAAKCGGRAACRPHRPWPVRSVARMETREARGVRSARQGDALVFRRLRRRGVESDARPRFAGPVPAARRHLHPQRHQPPGAARDPQPGRRAARAWHSS